MSSPAQAQQQVYEPSDSTLKRLSRLEKSSSDFSTQLTSLLSSKEYQSSSFLEKVPSEDRAWLIEYLDNVLDTLDCVGPEYRKCQDELERICYVEKSLPRSYMLDVSSLVPTADSSPVGPYETIYEGSLNGSKVCAKKLDPSLASGWRSAARVVKWKRLMHPNLVPFLGVTNMPIHIVSAWIPGVRLHEYITNHPETYWLDIVIGIANGLDYLHSQEMVHGDLGGPKVVVDNSGRPYITEPDLSSLFPKRLPSQINSCMRWAEPNFWPTRKSDIFSFAMVMVEVFTGQVPFFPESDPVARLAVERGERPERPIHADLTDGLWALMKKCWDQDPLRRPTILEVLGILRDCRDGVSVPVLPPAPIDVDLWEIDFALLDPETLVRLGEDFVRALPAATQGPPRSQMEEGWVDLICDTISRAGTPPTSLSSQDVAVLAETFRQAILRLNLSSPFMRDLWIRLGVHSLLCGLQVLPCVELSTESPGFEPFGFVDIWKGNYHGNPVCIKVIRTHDKSDLQKIKEIFDHGCKHFSHPNLLPVVQVSKALFPFCVISPWVPGGNIMQYIQKNPSTDRLMLLAEVCHGLSHLHGRDISHGCIAPGNILITRDGRACLGDLGIFGAFGALSFSRLKLGTARYMALERLGLLGGPPSKKSDIYSLAMTSFTVLTGIVPYHDARGHYPLMLRIVSGERPTRPANLDGVRFLPDSVWGMITACWSGDPDHRWEVSAMYDLFLDLSLQEVQKVRTDLRTTKLPRLGLLRRTAGAFRSISIFASFFQSLLVSEPEIQKLVERMDQRLESQKMSDKERGKFLNELCRICSQHCVIPKSMHIADGLNDATEVEYMGGSSRVSRSTYGEHQLAVKALNMRAQDLEFGPVRSGFCREVVAWKHLRHPNILPLLGVTFSKEKLWMISEWMDNGNVNEFIRKDPDANRTALLADVANGLKYMHDLRIVHGDLKGANILINKDRRACIVDFGLTTVTGVGVQSHSGTSPTSTISDDSLMPFVAGGTQRWMSPELLDPIQFGITEPEGDRPTRQSDCYTLGMVIYEILCGAVPFEEIPAGYQVVDAILRGRRPEKPEGAARLGFKDELWTIVEQCWRENRDERPRVEEILSCLNDATAFWYMREL